MWEFFEHSHTVHHPNKHFQMCMVCHRENKDKQLIFGENVSNKFGSAFDNTSKGVVSLSKCKGIMQNISHRERLKAIWSNTISPCKITLLLKVSKKKDFIII